MSQKLHEIYTTFLLDEMVVAFGCTEPIAIAYVAAVAAEALGETVDRLSIQASGNIIKNAKSVLVPNTDGCCGMEISAAMGAVLADPDKKLQILEIATPEDLEKAKQMVAEGRISVSLVEGIAGLYIAIRVESASGRYAVAIAKNEHTNIIYLDNNGTVQLDKESDVEQSSQIPFTFHDIYEYAVSGDLSFIRERLEEQKRCNMAVSKEGLSGQWGATIGKIVSEQARDYLYEQCVAAAAAGSDARMGGCSLPVVINSGSGNQGITVSVPVITYAQAIGASDEELNRALLFANAIAEYQKQGIGRLSAYCGVVSAASAAVAGIAFLEKQPEDVIARTLINSLATTSGMVCDGAKPSCAGKIATALRTAFLGYEQAKRGSDYHSGDGLVRETVDETIRSIGRVARIGMAQTDVEILKEMLGRS